MENEYKKFVAYFDILGYGPRIGTKSIEEEYNIWKKYFDDSVFSFEKINKEAGKRIVEAERFSDTMIFYTIDASEDSFKGIILSSLLLMLFSSIRAIPYLPVRGAICYGDFLVDKEKMIIIGEALREAYGLESQQEWMGCCLSQKCFNRARDYNIFKQFLSKGILVSYDVPFKKKELSLYTINMESFVRIFGNEIKDMPITKPEFIENIFKNKGLRNNNIIDIGNKEISKKLENTQKYFKYIETVKGNFE